jgi:thiol:disulfide interchange protein DsbD
VGCHELERKVFSRKEVVEAAREFVVVKTDLTDTDSPFSFQASMRHQIYVFPTVIFIGADGEERVRLRLLGSEGREQFLRRLRAAR